MDKTDRTIASEEERLVEILNQTDPTTEEYATVAKNLEALTRARKTNFENSIKVLEIVAGVATNLLGIGLVLNYEKLNVVTSKAFSMLKKT